MAHTRRIPSAKQVAIQGAPGTGKTRQGAALASLFAHRFHGRADAFRGQPLPTWAYRLIRAWRANPQTSGAAPRALPIAVITPMRVTTTWEREILAAYPGAEVMLIDRWQDVDAWMARCAVSVAPVVVGVFSQSKSRAFSLAWEPAVIERRRTVAELVTSAEIARRVILPAGAAHHQIPTYTPLRPASADDAGRALAQLVAEHGIRAGFLDPKGAALRIEGTDALIELERRADGSLAVHPLRAVTEMTIDGRVAGYLDAATGRPITVEVAQSHFFCPDCAARVEAAPDRRAPGDPGAADEDEAVTPVTSITYFTRQQRRCASCGTELWQRCRTDAGKQRYPMPTFADWSQGVDHLIATGAIGQFDLGGSPAGKPTRRRAAAPRRIARIVSAEGGQGRPTIDQVVCGAEAPSDFSPLAYTYMRYRGCVALTILDECHNTRGTATDVAHAAHLLCLAAQRYVYASGTIYGGMMSGFFHLWYRFDPQFWKGLGLGWGDLDEAVRRYGVVQQIIKEHESDARRGSGQTDVTVSTVPAPGISAKLLPRLLEKLVFIDTLDVGAFLPEKVEIPEVVDLDDPAVATLRAEAQALADEAESALRDARRTLTEVMNDPGATDAERAAADGDAVAAEEAIAQANLRRQALSDRAGQIDLAGSYATIEGTLEGMARRMIQPAILARGTLPRWWAALPCSAPPFTVTATRRTRWGDKISQETLFQAPVLASDHRYPIEQRLRAIVTAELAEGRTVMIYYEQNDIRSAADRLCAVLADLDPWVLPNSVEPEDREEAIRAAYHHGKRVFIVAYRRVSEGLNLQFLDTICWFELAMNLFHLEQSNLRIHRLGAQNQKRMYYLVYRHTVAHKKLTRLGSQSGAAALFAGNTPTGALVKASGADKTTLARMSAGLEVAQQGDEDPLCSDAELREAFRRRAAELNTALRQGRAWIGVTDTLPEQLRALRARQAAQAQGAEAPRPPAPAEHPAPARPEPVAVAPHPQPALPAPTIRPAGAIQFGNLDQLTAALKQRRKARRAERAAQARSLDLFSLDPRPAASPGPQQIGLLGL